MSPICSLTCAHEVAAPACSAQALHWCAQVEDKLYARANVNDQDSYGESALHAAASAGHLEIVRILVVEHEAALDAQNWEGWTPLICAVVRGHTAVAKFLAERVRYLLHPRLQGQCVTGS
jgi:ankyrin repeat protein